MAVDAKNVLVGTADQATTGAILSAPLGTTLPSGVSDALDKAFTDSGYVSNDGLTFTADNSTSDINEWNGALVRRLLESQDVTLSWAHLETNVASLRNAFGDNNVSTTPATADHGETIKVSIGSSLPAAKSWVFRLKDGDHRILIVVPNGQITSMDDVSFVANDAITWPVTLSTYPDSTGKNVYIYFDDGKTVAAGGDTGK